MIITWRNKGPENKKKVSVRNVVMEILQSHEWLRTISILFLESDCVVSCNELLQEDK